MNYIFISYISIFYSFICECIQIQVIHTHTYDLAKNVILASNLKKTQHFKNSKC